VVAAHRGTVRNLDPTKEGECYIRSSRGARCCKKVCGGAKIERSEKKKDLRRTIMSARRTQLGREGSKKTKEGNCYLLQERTAGGE